MSRPPCYTALKVSEIGKATIAGDLGVSLDRGAFSLCAWVMFDSFNSKATIMARKGEMKLAVRQNGFAFQTHGSPLVWQSGTPLTDGWRYLCVTFNKGKTRFFLDGDLKATGSCQTGKARNASPLVLADGLQGFLWKITIYKKELSEKEVKQSQFLELSSAKAAARFDFSQNPPVDTGPKRLKIKTGLGTESILVTPSLRLREAGYAYPMHERGARLGARWNDYFTIQAWIYPDPSKIANRNHPTQTIFMDKRRDSGSELGLSLRYQQKSGKFTLRFIRGPSGNARFSLDATAKISPGVWTNVAAAYDGFRLTLYVNGVVSGVKWSSPWPLSHGGMALGAELGEINQAAKHCFQGFLARVDVWRRPLSQTEITRYQGVVPGANAKGLEASCTFSAPPVYDSVNGHPVALVGAARIDRQISPAPVSSPVRRAAAPDIKTPEVSKDKLASWRASLDLPALLEEHGRRLDQARQADMAELENPADAALIQAAHRELRTRLKTGPGPGMPLLFTHHLEDGRYFLVGHHGQESYVAYEYEAAEMSCEMWRVTLVFTVIAGALGAFFGLQPRLSERAKAVIRKLLNIPGIRTRLASGNDITGYVLLRMLSEIYRRGYLKDLIESVVIDMGVWAMIRVGLQFLNKLMPAGWAAAVASLASTAVTFAMIYNKRPKSCKPIPTVTVSAIRFFLETDRTSGALCIRRDWLNEVKRPEWQLGDSSPQDAPAAYAIDQVRAGKVKIQAKLATAAKKKTSFQIRATGGGILGPIAPVTLTFERGALTPYEYATFELKGHQLAKGGVCAENATWTWQCRPSKNKPWTDCATTHHRIYALLSTPTSPWEQLVENRTQVPWTTALEHACAWAKGKKTEREALTAITAKVHSGLGLSYYGTTMHIGKTMDKEYFLLSAFLKFLNSETNVGKEANCTDCAAMVATFANLVGANIQTSTMSKAAVIENRHSGFTVNQTIPIGKASWEAQGSLFYHEVAWAGNAGWYDAIYDACLQLDKSGDPWDWSPGKKHQAVLPTGMAFTADPPPKPPIGTPYTAQTYRERLATNDNKGIGSVKPSGKWKGSNEGRRPVT